MQRRISTRIGLIVGGLLSCALVLQLVLMRTVVSHDTEALRARAGNTGLQLVAMGMQTGAFDPAAFERAFPQGPHLGMYDAAGRPLSRSRASPAQLPAPVLETLRREGDAAFLGDEGRTYCLRLPENLAPVRYISLSDGHVDRYLRETRLKVLALVTLVSLLVGLVATLSLTRVLRAKLLAARRTVRRVAEGELDVRFAGGSDDELGELSLDFNRMADRLGAHIEAVRGEDARRRQLFADWTHEIATPLTSVLGYLEALAESTLDPERRARYLAHAQVQARGLERLVEDLTVLSQLESEGISLVRERVDVSALVGSELEASVLRAPRLSIAGKELAPAFAELDAARFGQVLRNVLSNAERHARSRIDVTLETAGEERLRLRIADDGEGIPPEHLPHVTESFYRVDTSRDRKTGGRGLGLSIARRLVEAHAGTLHIASTVGQGTTVELVIPVRARKPDAA
jgi:signal transduction histidine kinase